MSDKRYIWDADSTSILFCTIDQEAVDTADTYEGDEIAARLNTLAARVAELEAAIQWALGETEDFPRWRNDGDGPFWWRKELRKRAALSGAKEG